MIVACTRAYMFRIFRQLRASRPAGGHETSDMSGAGCRSAVGKLSWQPSGPQWAAYYRATPGKNGKAMTKRFKVGRCSACAAVVRYSCAVVVLIISAQSC